MANAGSYFKMARNGIRLCQAISVVTSNNFVERPIYNDDLLIAIRQTVM
jgi:hypothetical protein